MKASRVTVALRVGTASAFALTAALIAWACNGDIPVDPTCVAIPDGGCPSSFGNACEDPTCATVYACTTAGWSFVRACPAREAGADSSSDDGASHDAQAIRDVQIDVPGAGGGPGCQDLQLPDCPLALAVSCPSGCCGCEDLFVCANGGWSDWGICGDGGTITPR